MKRQTRIPVKNATSSGRSSVASSSRALNFPSNFSNVDTADEVKKFCAEGTPSWMSKSNSHTNLSSLSIEDLKEPVIHELDRNEVQNTDTESSDSNDEELLQGCIKKAWDARKPSFGTSQVLHTTQGS